MSAAAPARPALGALAAAAFLVAVGAVGVVPTAAAPGGSLHSADGLGTDWDGEDVVGTGSAAPRAGSWSDLTALLEDDNATHWFFAVNFTVARAPDNETLAFYFFAGDQPGASNEPRGRGLELPSGKTLSFVIYLDLGSSGPDGSAIVFFDGSVWKNRTLQELGVETARNDTAGLLEVTAPRDTLLFLEAGELAAVLFDANGTALDAVPDLVGQPPRLGGALPFFDYSYHPPISFTSIGFSDPGAPEGAPVLLFLQLSNSGPKTATGVSAHVLVDGEPLGAREGLTLLPGGTAVMNFTWTARAGLHNFTATAFPGGEQRTISSIFSGAAAALVIEGVEVEPATVLAGTDFHVRVTVRNAGAATSSGAAVLLKDATRILSTSAVPELSPGGTANATLGAHYDSSGTRTLRVEIDGVNSPNATREVEVAVTAPAAPFPVPLEAIAGAGLVVFAVAMWFLTPRMLRERER